MGTPLILPPNSTPSSLLNNLIPAFHSHSLHSRQNHSPPSSLWSPPEAWQGGRGFASHSEGNGHHLFGCTVSCLAGAYSLHALSSSSPSSPRSSPSSSSGASSFPRSKFLPHSVFFALVMAVLKVAPQRFLSPCFGSTPGYVLPSCLGS